jgi:ribosome-associated protein
VRIHAAKHQSNFSNASGRNVMSTKLRISHRVLLDENELQEQFVRAPGPGGQNVNKLATAVQLRWDVARSVCVPEDVRARLLRLAGRRVTDQGVLIIDAHRHRTQARNRQDARERLFELIRAASVAPKPRKATKPSAAARERRLQAKRARGEVKRARARREPE